MARAMPLRSTPHNRRMIRSADLAMLSLLTSGSNNDSPAFRTEPAFDGFSGGESGGGGGGASWSDGGSSYDGGGYDGGSCDSGSGGGDCGGGGGGD